MTRPVALILGATSDMAQALAQQLAKAGHDLVLSGRNLSELEAIGADLRVRYSDCHVACRSFEATETAQHQVFVETLERLPELAVCFVGTLGDEMGAREDPKLLADILRSNFEGPAHILGVLANAFAARGSGTLVGVSSVAGERGRKSNYVYGSAKAGFTAFLSGLRNRLEGQGVHVITVLPGFVATKMTRHMALSPVLTAQPSAVAAAILAAVRKRKNIVYVKPVWFIIMTIIKFIPENIFKKMSL